MDRRGSTYRWSALRWKVLAFPRAADATAALGGRVTAGALGPVDRDEVDDVYVLRSIDGVKGRFVIEVAAADASGAPPLCPDAKLGALAARLLERLPAH
ncbi:MAG: hypothetical protein SFX73_06730 [Kofleriaceae bacterium]|nr:hypothetical protein [Kofleriaceae bacterium]